MSMFEYNEKGKIVKFNYKDCTICSETFTGNCDYNGNECGGEYEAKEAYLKSIKIVEDLRKCEEYLLELCNSNQRNRNICEALTDLDECRLFLEAEFHKGDLSFHTYRIGSLKSRFCETGVSSYEDVVKRINLVFDQMKGKDEKITQLLENIIISMGKNPLCL